MARDPKASLPSSDTAKGTVTGEAKPLPKGRCKILLLFSFFSCGSVRSGLNICQTSNVLNVLYPVLLIRGQGKPRSDRGRGGVKLPTQKKQGRWCFNSSRKLTERKKKQTQCIVCRRACTAFKITSIRPSFSPAV